MSEKPTFKAWTHENLSKLIDDIWDQNVQLREANEQLRLDLKDAMKELRKYQDDWK